MLHTWPTTSETTHSKSEIKRQFAIIGILFLGSSAMFAFLILNQNAERMMLRRAEISELTTHARSGLGSLSREIYNELSAIHVNKRAPHDHSNVVREVKETDRGGPLGAFAFSSMVANAP